MAFLEKLKNAVASTRFDGWFNDWTGLGTPARDRASHTAFAADPWLDDHVLAGLYHFDDIARTIVSVYPEEALREGFIVADAETDKALEDLRARSVLEEAATWGRLYGGGVVVIGTDDAHVPASDPLTPGARVKFLAVYDKREVTRELVCGNTHGTDYGESSVLRISPRNGRTFLVHRSRCLIFGGQKTAKQEREGRGGWDASVLQAVYPVVRDFGAAYLALSNMLTDASQGVLKMQGLIAALTSKEDELTRKRLALLDLSRSVARSVFLDADGNESYERIPAAFGGVPDVMDRFAHRLAAATRIPVTILMGQAPAGLQATGASDIRAWYSSVSAYQRKEIEPQIRKLLRVMGAADTSVRWPSLWQETETERASRHKTEAETDQIFATIGTITPEEVFATDRVRERYPEARAELRSATLPAQQIGLASAAKPDHVVGNEELAADMSAWRDPITGLLGKRHCEHGRANRCEHCGVERTRALQPDGSWAVAWKAYGA